MDLQELNVFTSLVSKRLVLSFALVLALALGGCANGLGETVSDVASAANPFNWFGSDEKKSAETEQKIETPEDRSSYPSLASVPDSAPKVSSVQQRMIIEEGLMADRANARYTAGPAPNLYTRDEARPLMAVPREKVEEASLSQPKATAPAISDPVRIATIRFPEGSAEMPEDSANYLREVVSFQRQQGGALMVVGHSDSLPKNADPAADRQAKIEISMARAKAVAQRLVALGAHPEQVVVDAKGDSEPVAPASEPARQQENRRVDVFLVRSNN